MKESKKPSDSKVTKKSIQALPDLNEDCIDIDNSLIEKLRFHISSLTYQEALEKLDLILQKLQLDEVPVEDLQRQYLKKQLYLKKYKNLLAQVQQQVTEIKL